MTLILYFLAALGFAFVVGHSDISYGFRRVLNNAGGLAKWLLKLLECVGCTGFWTGVAWAIVTHSQFFVDSRIADAVLFGLATSGSNLILARIAGLTDSAQT